MSDVLSVVLIGSCIVPFILAWIVHAISFFYLQMSNGYDKYPFWKINFELFVYYDKKVKEKDITIKKVCNISLVIVGYSFAGMLILTVIKALI